MSKQAKKPTLTARVRELEARVSTLEAENACLQAAASKYLKMLRQGGARG